MELDDTAGPAVLDRGRGVPVTLLAGAEPVQAYVDAGPRQLCSNVLHDFASVGQTSAAFRMYNRFRRQEPR